MEAESFLNLPSRRVQVPRLALICRDFSANVDSAFQPYEFSKMNITV